MSEPLPLKLLEADRVSGEPVHINVEDGVKPETTGSAFTVITGLALMALVHPVPVYVTVKL